MDLKGIRQLTSSVMSSAQDPAIKLGTFAECKKSSLRTVPNKTEDIQKQFFQAKAWPSAEYIVTSIDEKDAFSNADCLTKWAIFAAKLGCKQYLIMEVAPNKWEMYDGHGAKMGDEAFIENYFAKFLDSGLEDVEADRDPLQVIWYGAPGTGKSYKIKDDIKNLPEENVIRTTFHPDSDYATFVGSYKPITVLRDSYALDAAGNTHKIAAPQEEKIIYKFIPQAFLQAYCQAWKKQAEGEKVVLVIEEINRGNCAQIFGDIFQLLDRTCTGFSNYAIKPDADITKFIHDDPLYSLAGLSIGDVKDDDGQLVAEGAKIANGEKMVLPNNLYIYATMNTSDQSLFPIDSAFKRRWDWEYVPIEQPKIGAKGDPRKWKIKADGHWCYWWEFLQAINEEIEDVTHSEDKQLGYFFAKPQDGEYVDAKTFVSKVVFYLWNDVFKDENSEIFRYKDLEGKWKVDMPAPKRDNLYFRSFVKGREDVDEKMVRWFVNNLLKEHKVVLLNDSHQTPVTSDDNPKEEEIAWMRLYGDVPPSDEDRTEDDMSSINVTDVNFLNDEYKPADLVENVDR